MSKILQEYAAKDSRVRIFNSEKPKLIPTLQVAYAQTKGTLINRMDSDDKMPDYKIQVLVDEWNKHGKGNVIAGGTKHFVDEGSVGDGFIKYEEWLNEVARSSTHYQEIYKELLRLKKEFRKPLVVSMENVAASGGLYVSLPADVIYANGGTITGSIGVIIQKMNIEGLMKKLGVQILEQRDGWIIDGSDRVIKRHTKR